MAQGGFHRGVAVYKGAPGFPVAQPSPGHTCFPLPCVSAQVHLLVTAGGNAQPWATRKWRSETGGGSRA